MQWEKNGRSCGEVVTSSLITTMHLPILQLSCRLFFLAKLRITQVYETRFCSMRLLVFHKSKIAVERKKICEFDRHTVHKFSQRRLTADWLSPRKSDCSRMRSKISSAGRQVTSRPHDRFSRYSKWLDTSGQISYTFNICYKLYLCNFVAKSFLNFFR